MDGAAPLIMSRQLGGPPRPRFRPYQAQSVLTWYGFSIMASSAVSLVEEFSYAGELVSPAYVFTMYVVWMIGMIIMLLPVMLPTSPHVARMGALVAMGMLWFIVAAFDGLVLHH